MRCQSTCLGLLTLAAAATAAHAEPAKSEFDPAEYCNDPHLQSQMPLAARMWGRAEGDEITRDGRDFRVSDVRVASFEAGENVVCRVTLSLNYPKNGGLIAIQIMDADFMIFGNDDGSETYVKAYNWPTAEEMTDPNNSYNRHLVVNGETFEQAWDRKRASQPANIVEALVGAQNAYNAQVEAELRRKGLGSLLDAEKARRAKLTPQQRAAEDAYNRGPAPGETICIDVNGVRRCKTGR